MAVNASNIHKPLESLEVRPVVLLTGDTAECRLSNESVTDSQNTARQFTLDVNLTACSAPTITLKATTLSGKLVSTIDSELPDYRFPIPVSPQGMGYVSCIYAHRTKALVTCINDTITIHVITIYLVVTSP